MKHSYTAVKDNEMGDRVSLALLFSTADYLDWFYMIIGSLCAIISGFSYPSFNIFFGKMMNTINGSQGSFQEEVDRISVDFLILSIINFVSAYVQVYCWTYTGERQAHRIR
jgi:ATP-binding cassette subfamily B (MDR/TAP) protein 1